MGNHQRSNPRDSTNRTRCCGTSFPIVKGHPAGTTTPRLIVGILYVCLFLALYRSAVTVDSLLRTWPATDTGLAHHFRVAVAFVSVALGVTSIFTLWHSHRYCVLVTLAAAFGATPHIALAVLSAPRDDLAAFIAANVSVAAMLLQVAFTYRLHLAYTKDGPLWGRWQVVLAVYLGFAYAAAAAVQIILVTTAPAMARDIAIFNTGFLYVALGLSLLMLALGWIQSPRNHRKRFAVLVCGSVLWIMTQFLLIQGTTMGAPHALWPVVASVLLVLAPVFILLGSVIGRVWFLGRGASETIAKGIVALLSPIPMLLFHEHVAHFVHETWPAIPEQVASAPIVLALLFADIAKDGILKLLDLWFSREEKALDQALARVRNCRSICDLGLSVAHFASLLAKRTSLILYTLSPCEGLFKRAHATVYDTPEVLPANEPVVALLDLHKVAQDMAAAGSTMDRMWKICFPIRSKGDRLVAILMVGVPGDNTDADLDRLQSLCDAIEESLTGIGADAYYSDPSNQSR